MGQGESGIGSYGAVIGVGRAGVKRQRQIAASNVIVMLVREWPTPYPEDITGSLENELTLKGSGPAWVFRDGAQFYGKWERPLLDHPTVFVETDGTRITLTPGNTWEELVPDGRSIEVKP